MSIRTIEELLVDCSLFADLPAHHLETIAGCASIAHFQEGQLIFREGGDAERFYVVRAGSVAIETHVPGQGQARLLTIHPDEVLGWSWLFAPYRWHFDARALDHVRTLAFDGECLRGKSVADHELGYELMRRFAQVMLSRLQATRMQLLDVYHHV